jgi:glycosyltransferase involved in cell wall biosynthesis
MSAPPTPAPEAPSPDAQAAERSDTIAIVWAPHEARTAAFAHWLGAPLHNVHYLKARRPWLAPLKYVLQWLKTWQILFAARPATVYVTNSPPVAGLCVYAYCLLSRARFVLDTHPPTIFGRKWGWTLPLQRFTARRAAVNVVDQERFRELFESWGARALVLENPPKPVPAGLRDEPPDAENAFVYVGTFAADEPVGELLEAARRLPHVRLYVLGDTELADRRWVEGAPENVTFTGYLLADEYWRRLARSRAVIVLTTHEHSLLGGAQDGMNVETPLLLSDQPTLREHFTGGTVFVPNTADGLAAGMEQVLRDEERLRAEIARLRASRSARWTRDFERLRTIVEGPPAPSRAPRGS